MRANLIVATGLLSGLSGYASAQTAPTASQQEALLKLFETHDLVCSSLNSCQWKPKAGGAPLVAPPPPLAAAMVGPAAATPTAPNTPPPPPAATPVTKKTFAKALSDLQVDLSVPSSPAFAVLGVSPSEIQRPGSARMLAAAVARGFDEDGKPKTGIALDFAPMLVFGRQAIKGGEDYAGNLWKQIATRTTVSYGTTKEEDGKASKQGWGIRVGLLDYGDPGVQYKRLLECIPTLPRDVTPVGPNVDGLTEDQEKAFSDAVAGCKLEKGLWAKPALYVGFGESRHSSNGKLSGTTPAAKAWWATYSQGVASDAKFTVLFQLHASRTRDDRVQDPDDDTKLIRQDSKQLIARLTAGQDKWHAFADVGRKRVTLGGSIKESLRHTGIGAEFKIQDDMWLQIGSVRESGYADGSSRQMVTSGLRFGSEPIFTKPGD